MATDRARTEITSRELHHALKVGEDLVVLRQFVRVGKGCLSYLIGAGGQAVVVDPARHVEQYVAEAEAHGLKIAHISDTHLHADHLSGASKLAERTGATYHIAAEDAAEGRLGAAPIQGELEIGLGPTKVEVLAEPMVLPAHFSDPSEVREDGIVAGSMGDLRAKNPVLHVDSEEAFVRFIKASVTPQPEIYNEIRKINLALLRVDEGRALELELGENQCAVTRSGA